MDRLTFVFLGLLGLVLALPQCLRGSPAHTDPSEVFAAGCVIVDAVTDNAIAESICAHEDEIGTVLDAIAAMRVAERDAGAKVLRCRPLPLDDRSPPTCATEAERRAAIRAVILRRALDGGAAKP